MIVEFIGSSGAGKTTLISKVHHKLANVTEVTSCFDLVASKVGLRHLTNPTARNLIQELVGFPYVIRSFRKHDAFVTFVLRMLARQANFSIFTLNNLRSLERKIGAYEIIRRDPRNQVVLVDEGTVLLAHNIFVYSDVSYTWQEIARFASLVPLPDRIIYIKAPVDILVERSLRRTDAPREMKSKERAAIEKYADSAVRMFDELVKADNIQRRLLIVENCDQDDHKHDMVVNDIVNFILDCQPSAQSNNQLENNVNRTHD
jgi:thymidylate kinase